MIPEELENVTTEAIPRRRMIKRIGAGAAIAWSAPILTSIRTPAFAYTHNCSDTGCPEENFAPCTGNPPGCGSGACYGGLGCFKKDDTEGTAVVRRTRSARV